MTEVVLTRRPAGGASGDPGTLAVPEVEQHVAEHSLPRDLDLEIPGYQLLGVLGEGGMGVVLAARDLEVGRMVAIKALLPKLAHRALLAQRFEREADTLARLHHPNIVGIVARGESGGRLYFVMEHVQGPAGRPIDLRSEVRSGGCDPRMVRRWGLQTAAALGYAHGKGVIHRDVKPSNLMLDIDRNVKVADFGIAAVAEDGGDFALTQSAVSVGTPVYMAPEQLARTGAVDARADVYSLGVTLYQLLTGCLPIGSYDPPSALGLNPEWDAVLDKALQQKPERRFASMAEFATALEALNAGPKPRGGPAAGATPAPGQCPRCDGEVKPGQSSCGDCGQALRSPCPKCGHQGWWDAPECSACGIDFAALRQFEHALAFAKAQLLAARRAGMPPHQAWPHAEAAALEVCKARKLFPADPAAQALLAEAEALASALAWDAACAAANGAEAVRLREFLRGTLARNPAHDAARLALEELEQRRRQDVEAAQAAGAAGDFKSAVDRWTALADAFPDDLEIRAAKRETAKKLEWLREAVTRRAPDLERRRRWQALSELLNEIHATRAKVANLPALAERAKAALAQADRAALRARKRLDGLDLPAAQAAVREALTVCEDHRAALLVQSAMLRMERELALHGKRLQATVANGEWSLALLRLAEVERACGFGNPAESPFQELRARIAAGAVRDRRQRRMRLASIAGTLAWPAAGWAAGAAAAALAGFAGLGAGAAAVAGFLTHALAALLLVRLAACRDARIAPPWATLAAAAVLWAVVGQFAGATPRAWPDLGLGAAAMFSGCFGLLYGRLVAHSTAHAAGLTWGTWICSCGPATVLAAMSATLAWRWPLLAALPMAAALHGALGVFGVARRHERWLPFVGGLVGGAALASASLNTVGGQCLAVLGWLVACLAAAFATREPFRVKSLAWTLSVPTVWAAVAAFAPVAACPGLWWMLAVHGAAVLALAWECRRELVTDRADAEWLAKTIAFPSSSTGRVSTSRSPSNHDRADRRAPPA